MPTATALALDEPVGIHDLQDTYLDCRTLGHWWSRTHDDGMRLREWVNTRERRRKVFVCGNCTMMRYDVWNRMSGAIDARAYKPPLGYKISGKPEKWQLRKEALKRWAD